MSSNTPQGPAGPPEYLGPASGAGSARTGGSGKKWAVLGGVAIGVVAVIGLGGWVGYTLLSGAGSQPSDAIPASAVGYVSVDLDPSASQKIEALGILKKFPGIEQELDIGDRDDLRRWVFDLMQEEGACEKLDYTEDIEPWIGDRVALAAVPGEKNEVIPLVALQVSDEEAATTGIEALAECGEAGDEFGFAFAGDYALITDGEQRAESMAADAEEGSLADDEQFQEWTDAAGGDGIITMYASAEAPGYLMDMQEDLAAPQVGYSEATEPETLEGSNEQLKELYKDFEGMAAVVRFEDGAVEMEFAGKGAPTGLPGSQGGSDTGINTLPADTGAAMSVAFSDGWLEKNLQQLAPMFGGEAGLEEGLAELEAQTGLAVPEDVESLLGDDVSVALDSEIDFETVAESEDPSQLPAGIKVHGDPDEILTVVDKIKAKLGPAADVLVVESNEDYVAFGFDQDYVDSLLAEGELGDDETFQNVVPDADEASGVLYIDFDAGDGWAEQFADFASGGDPEARENVEPLDALGMSTWVDDDVQHGLFRLTTD